MTLDEAIDRLYDLNPGTTPVEEGSPHERPHKPLLLLAAKKGARAARPSLQMTGRLPVPLFATAANQPSFIDAAHLIPFSESHNDHPTNGPMSRHSRRRRRITLCKNHHWAMDRDILAPGPDLHWLVSKLIEPRRSTGEKKIHSLSGQTVFLPKDPAFYPEAEGLSWRLQRLIA